MKTATEFCLFSFALRKRRKENLREKGKHEKKKKKEERGKETLEKKKTESFLNIGHEFLLYVSV